MSAGVPSYFFGGCFFVGADGTNVGPLLFFVDDGAAVDRAATLAAILVTGVLVMIRVGQENQIETLSSCGDGRSYCMTRIPGADIEGVEHYLRQHNVTSVWTTISFVYPLLFESDETLVVSNAIFEDPHRVYPQEIPWREPSLDSDTAFVLKPMSPFRPSLEIRYAQAIGVAPLIREYGKLTLIAGRSGNDE